MVYSSAKMTPYDQWRRYDVLLLLATNVKKRQSDVTLMTQRPIIIMSLCRLIASCPEALNLLFKEPISLIVQRTKLTSVN